MSEVQLPDGWVWKKLGKSVAINPKLSRKDIPAELQVSFLPMRMVEEVTGRFNLAETRQYSEVKKGFTAFQDEDIIFAKVTPCMENGKMAVVTGLKNEIGFGSTEFHVFRCQSELNNRYLFYFLVQRQFRHEAEGSMTGAVGLRRVPKSFLEEYLIPLPPLPVQHQIVARIEELFSELDAGVNELKTALSRLKTYRQAVLHHYLNNPDWEYTEIGTKCECIVPNRDKPRSFSGNIYWITIPDLPDSSTSIDYQSIKLGLSKDEVKQYNARVVPPGSVIMTCVGRFGLSAVVEYPLVINQQLHAFLPTNHYLPKFIAYTIRLNKSYFEKNATATTIAYLNKSKCNSMPIPIVDINSQAQIVSKIEARLSEADAMETTIRQELVRAENLQQSILKQVFEGKLVPSATYPAAQPDVPNPATSGQAVPEVAEPAPSNYGGKADQLTLF